MAKRPNLSAVDLKDTSTQRAAPAEPARNSKAQTLRLPPEYWRRLRIAAAIADTSQISIVQKALDDWFKHNPLPSGLDL
jgi:predicted HicB family RNase H-like nuclease